MSNDLSVGIWGRTIEEAFGDSPSAKKYLSHLDSLSSKITDYTLNDLMSPYKTGTEK